MVRIEHWLRILRLRVRSLFRRKQVEQELAEEMRYHVERQTETLIGKGINSKQARYESLRRLGGIDRHKEECRDTRRVSFIENLTQDVRYGWRNLRKNPGFSIVAILTLALGIGATTAVFSIANAVLLRPLPYKNPKQLVAIFDGEIESKNLGTSFPTYRDFDEWKSHNQSFEQLAAEAWFTGEHLLTGHGPRIDVFAAAASMDFFSLLGVPPAMGRTFQQDDLTRGCTVVLAHRFWETALGSDPNIIGQNLRLNDDECTVAGVMPGSFTFYPEATALWRLITPATTNSCCPAGVGVFGRLKPQVRLQAAQTEFTALHRNLNQNTPHGAHFAPVARPLQDWFTWLTGRNLRLTLLALLGSVAFVLLIACVNVANLLLGRSLRRQRELAVRAALGSSRRRLIQQMLTEGILLSLAAAAVGVLLAQAAIRYFQSVQPIELPPGVTVTFDATVLAFGVALAFITALLFSLFPAWKASRVDIQEALKATVRSASATRSGRRLGNALVLVEMSFSVVLLVGAGLLIGSLIRLTGTPIGFNPNNLWTVGIQIPQPSEATVEQRNRFYEDTIQNLHSLPGVQGVTAATTLPYVGNHTTDSLTVEGTPDPDAAATTPNVMQIAISADYFPVMEIPITKGRMFNASDRERVEPVAIVNEALARRFFPNTDPIGKRVRYGNNRPWVTIVGIAANEKEPTLEEMKWDDLQALYRPIAQVAPNSVEVILRTAERINLSAPSIKNVITSLNAEAVAGDIQTMNERISKYFLAPPRFRTQIFGTFAALALLLAVVGLYGVLSQLVAGRTHEIGIRMSLGATRGSVTWMVMRECLALVGLGVVFGVTLSFWLSRLLKNLLFEVPQDDLRIVIAAIALLVAAATLAGYLPARRASRIDPMTALRLE